MESLAETWFLWLILSGVVIMLLNFLRESKRNAEKLELFTSEHDFSVTTLLFGLKKGEGDVFLGYLLAVICFSLFLAGFVRWIRILF